MDGNLGLLGAEYPGYFPVGDTEALARLMRRVEVEPAFVRRLTRAVRDRARLFRPAREQAAWRRLLAGLRLALDRDGSWSNLPDGSTSKLP